MGPSLASRLTSANLFKAIVYPLRPDDKMDIVIVATFEGKFVADSALFVKAIFTGLLLWLPAPAVEYEHHYEASATIWLTSSSAQQLKTYKASSDIPVMMKIFAPPSEVETQGVKAATSDLMEQIVGQLQKDKAILAKVGRGTMPAVAASTPGAVAPAAPVVSSSDVDRLPAATVKPRRNAHAIVIGIEQYQQELPKADFAARDAEVVGQYLTKTMGYAGQNVVVLLNDRAAKAAIEKYIEGWLPDRVEPGDSVFIYFSGHGAPNTKTGKAYLVPYDGDPVFVEQTGYPLDRLYSRLAALPAKEIIVMLDSCFSGAGGRSVIAEGMRPMLLSVENPVLATGKIVVLIASSGSQVSSTFKEQGHGLLTYYFLKGLQGEADENRDSRIELGELFNFLKPQVEQTARREYHNEQTPQLLGNPGMLSKGVVLMEAGTR